MRCGSAFNPNALPDTCHGRIPDASGLRHLLAARNLGSLVSGIQHFDNKLLGLSFQVWGYINGERSVSSCMGSHQDAVQVDLSGPVDSLEMKQSALALPGGRHAEGSPVPQGVVLPYALPHTGE